MRRGADVVAAVWTYRWSMRLRAGIGQLASAFVVALLAGVAFWGMQATGAVAGSAEAAGAGWKVTTLAGGRQAWLAGVSALPGGHTAVLLDERRGRDHRLVLYRPGRSPRTLMTSTHTFGASLGADARGNLAVAWYTIPSGASHRRAYFWAGRKVFVLTDGTRHAMDALAVTRNGKIVVAVSEASPGGRPGRVQVRRSAFGAELQSVEAADLQYFYPGALALGPSGAVAIGGGRWDVPGALTASLAVSVSRSFDAAFLPAARLAPATVAPPSVPITQGPAVGFGPGNTAIAATNTLNCLVGTGDLSEPCSPGVAGSTLQVWLWPASAAAPTAPIRHRRPASPTSPSSSPPGRRRGSPGTKVRPTTWTRSRSQRSRRIVSARSDD